MTANRKITREESRIVPASLYRVERVLEKLRSRLKTPVVFIYHPGHAGTIEDGHGKVILQWHTKEELDTIISNIISFSHIYFNQLITNYKEHQ